MAVAIELLIIVWLIAAEVIEHRERPAFAVASVKAAFRKEQEADAALKQPAATGSPPLVHKAQRPRLIASQPRPIGNVAAIMADILEPGRGKVEIAALYEAYAVACKASGKRPVAAAEFPYEIAKLCAALGVAIVDQGEGVFLSKVKIVST